MHCIESDEQLFTSALHFLLGILLVVPCDGKNKATVSFLIFLIYENIPAMYFSTSILLTLSSASRDIISFVQSQFLPPVERIENEGQCIESQSTPTTHPPSLTSKQNTLSLILGEAIEMLLYEPLYHRGVYPWESFVPTRYMGIKCTRTSCPR